MASEPGSKDLPNVVEESTIELDNTITFNWVRHAESIANLGNNKPSDSYTKKTDKERIQKEMQKFQVLEYLHVKKMKKSNQFGILNRIYNDVIKPYYDTMNDEYNNEYYTTSPQTKLKEECKDPYVSLPSNLTEYDILNPSPKIQAIFDKIWTFGKRDVVNNGCITTLDALLLSIKDDKQKEKEKKKEKDSPEEIIKKKDEQKRKYAYWLQNMITTNFLISPTLTYVGIQQSINLGKELDKLKIEADKPYDLIISSATVRTLMTAYIALKMCDKETVPIKTITIVPYTNEKENDAQWVFYDVPGLHDFANAAIHPNDIAAVCNAITTHFDKHESDKHASDYPNFNNDDKSVVFDFVDYLELAANKNEEEIDKIRQNNIDEFWSYFNKKENFKNKENILSFCHGYAIDEVRKKLDIDYDKLYASCIEDKNTLLELKFRSWGGNTSIFQHKYAGGEVIAMVGEKYNKGNCLKENKLDPDFTESLKNNGLIYIPIKIRNDKFLKGLDKFKLNDKLSELKRGSLRYEIAKITLGEGKEIDDKDIDVEEIVEEKDIIEDMSIPDKITVASYNMSFMSDRGLNKKGRNQVGVSEAAFLARLRYDEHDPREYWLNALKLLDDFMNEHKDCIIGLQELNQTKINSNQGSDAINNMLKKYPGYIQVGDSVEAWGDHPGLSIIYNRNMFGEIKHFKIYDLEQNIGRPRLFVLTEKGYLFITTHGNQNGKLGENMEEFNKIIVRDSIENLKRDANTFVDSFHIKPDDINRIFLMGDFNDRYDVIKKIDILPRRHLKYKGKAPLSCCYNWDSSCSDKSYLTPFADKNYGYCTHKPKSDKEGHKLPMDEEGEIKEDYEGAKKNYRYTGDKVFGENPLTEIKIFDNTGKEISEESDHQMVYATFSSNAINVNFLKTKYENPTGGRSKKHHRKTRKGIHKKNKTRRIQGRKKNRKTKKGKNRKTRR